MTNLSVNIETTSDEKIANYLGISMSQVKQARRAGATTMQHVYDFKTRGHLGLAVGVDDVSNETPNKKCKYDKKDGGSKIFGRKFFTKDNV